MQQRYYDPMAGRFLSVDPVLTDANTGASFNRYVYVNNNPYKYIDPDGRELILAPDASKAFKDKVITQLAIISSTQTGREMISTIMQSPHSIVIGPASGESYATANNYTNAENGRGSGGTISHDPARSPTTPVANGSTAQAPPAVVLAHELAHGVDYVKGTLPKGDNPKTGIPRAEEKAVKVENKVREELKLPKRELE
jgi:uncharacterized protein RhaS with RHS repeats